MWGNVAVTFLMLLRTVSCLCEDPSDSAAVYEVLSLNPPAACSYFSEFDEALTFALAFNSSEIRVTETLEEAISVVQKRVMTEVELVGVGNTLRFDESILIEGSGRLTIRNVILESSRAESAFEVQGFLQLVNCTVSLWPRKVIQVARGFVVIEKCICQYNGDFIVAGSDLEELVISDSAFSSNSGVAVLESTWEKSMISIFNNTFLGNRRNPIFSLKISSNISSTASISMHNNSYRNCDSLLVNAYLENVSVSMTSEEYINNTAGGIVLSQTEGLTVVSGCRWVDSSFPFIYIPLLQGEVEISKSEFIGQRFSAPIQIVNSIDASSCRVTVDQSSFHDYSISPLYPTAGAVLIYLCTALVSNCEMWNIAAVTSDMQLAYGLCVLQRSYCELRNITVKGTVMPGSVVVFSESSGSAGNVLISNSTAGSNSIIVAIGSQVNLDHIEISYCASTARLNIFAPIFIEKSQATLSNIFISDNTKRLTSVLSVFYSEVECLNSTFRNVWGQTAFVQLHSNFSGEHLRCWNCSLIHYSETVGISSALYRNVSIVSSQLKLGVFIGSPGSFFSISDIDIAHSAAQALVSCESATVSGANVALRNVSFQSLLGMVQFSRVSLQAVTSWQSIGGIVSIASSSRIQLAYCGFGRIETLGTAIFLQSSLLQITKSEFREVTCEVLAEVFPLSTLELTEVTMSYLHSTVGEFVRARNAEVTLVNSAIMDFYGTFLHCEECTVVITGCLVKDGGFHGTREAGSQSNMGGLLQCVDCLTISISNTRIFNISSDLGGAVYCSAETASSLTIFDSSFKDCSALRGGAVLAVNVSVTVEYADFSECSAEMQGGAMYLSIAAKYQRRIANSRFFFNRAHEGGAVQWRGAPIELTEVLFHNNSAHYGPDIASYGVNVSAVIPTAIAPGQPITLSFELLDHYQQRVTNSQLPLLRLIRSSGLNFSGITDKVIVEGTTNFTNISLISSPASNQTLLAQCQIENSDTDSSFINSSYTVVIRHCVVGEIKGTNNCTICNPGYYSLSLNDTQCNLCPSLAICHGGNNILPKISAWLIGNPSEPVVACFNDNKCLGTSKNLCEEGYSGPLCSKCADNWFPLVTASCTQCPNISVFVVECVAVIIIIIVTLLFVLRFSVISHNLVGLTCVKVMWTHAQYLGALSFIRTSYPTALQVLFRAMLDVASLYTATFPFDCFGLNYIYITASGTLSGVIIILLSVMFTIYRCMKSKCLNPFHSELPALLSFVNCVISISALFSFLQLFACDTVGNSDPLLVIDMTEKCWEGNHYKAVIAISVISIFLHVFISAVVDLIARKHVSDLMDCKFRWTLLNIGIKVVALVSIIVQLSGSRLSQLFLGMLCLYFSILANVNSEIYIELGCFILVESSYFVLAATYSLLFVFFQYNNAVCEVIITCLIYVLNAGFFVSCWLYTRSYRKLNRQNARSNMTVYHSANDSSGVALQSVQIEVN